MRWKKNSTIIICMRLFKYSKLLIYDCKLNNYGYDTAVIMSLKIGFIPVI